MAYSVPYFKNLATAGIAVLNSLPIEITPQPLDYTLNKLKPAIDEIKAGKIKELTAIEKSLSTAAPHNLAPGMNTIGMLTDRFTILLIREWCFRNKRSDNNKADDLFKTQTLEIIQALAEAQPGYSSLNSKITSIKADAKALNWEEAYYGLLTTNLLLWESQEVLYIKDIQSLPVEEIRDYIKWFSS